MRRLGQYTRDPTTAPSISIAKWQLLSPVPDFFTHCTADAMYSHCPSLSCFLPPSSCFLSPPVVLFAPPVVPSAHWYTQNPCSARKITKKSPSLLENIPDICLAPLKVLVKTRFDFCRTGTIPQKRTDLKQNDKGIALIALLIREWIAFFKQCFA